MRATQATINAKSRCEEAGWDKALRSTRSPAMASVRALRRAGARRTTTPRRPIRIQRPARDRVGAATGKRGPSDGDPTAGNARARLPASGAASGLGRVKWLEPESDSNPRNSANQLGFDF